MNQSGSPSTTTLYVYDLKGHVIAETDTTGATRREYIWMDDLPVAVVSGVNTANPTIYYVHADHLGRPARMTAQDQSWVWDVIYSPFGATSTIWSNPATLDLRFPGQWFQLETGLAYNWHRGAALVVVAPMERNSIQSPHSCRSWGCGGNLL